VNGAVVLAGGRSRRMGRDKASLDWYGVPLLVHACSVVREGVDGGPVVVVASAGQALPELPAWAAVAADARPGIGPMQGLLDGLRALPAGVDRVFLAACDAPLLRPAFVASLLARLEAEPEVEALIPFVRGHRHPLLAAYRASTAGRLEEAIIRGERRAGQIFRLRLVGEDELLHDERLARADPELVSVEDVDTVEAYEAALARGG